MGNREVLLFAVFFVLFSNYQGKLNRQLIGGREQIFLNCNAAADPQEGITGPRLHSVRASFFVLLFSN